MPYRSRATPVPTEPASRADDAQKMQICETRVTDARLSVGYRLTLVWVARVAPQARRAVGSHRRRAPNRGPDQ